MEPTGSTTVGHGQERLRTRYRKRSLQRERSMVVVKEKILKLKQYQQSRCDEDKEEFREANKRAKREVAKAKESAYKGFYHKLDSIEGQKIIYKLSKTR